MTFVWETFSTYMDGRKPDSALEQRVLAQDSENFTQVTRLKSDNSLYCMWYFFEFFYLLLCKTFKGDLEWLNV